MKILLLHPTGNANVKAISGGLAAAGMLAEVNSALVADPSAAWLKLLPQSLKQEWLRRTFPAPARQIWPTALLEVSRLVLSKTGFAHYVEQPESWTSMYAVYKQLDAVVARRLAQAVATQQVTAVYAYEDGALATFTRAKELGLTCIYDLPIAFWQTVRHLLQEEAERLPHWAPTLRGGIQDPPAKLERKTRELELADVVIGPGSFVMNSLPPWASGKQLVSAPFGSPQLTDAAPAKLGSGASDTAGRPLQVLFVGALGQRKGLADLFAAMRLLNRPDIQLRVLGPLLAPLKFYQAELPGVIYEPERSHAQVLALMRSCDVFCLPSIVEGRALVMQEAMSQGLPLIITPNTGGADLIIEGQTGFLVPIRSPEAIAEKLAWFLDHRDQLPAMGQHAQAHAARYTWDSYATQIIEALR